MPIVAQVPAEPEPGDILREYWADAKQHYLNGDFPDYASPAWRALEPDDPRKLAGALLFAEMWRRFGDEIAADLDNAIAYREPPWRRPTLAELNQRHDEMLARNRRGHGNEAA
ncbi:hypothetical protein [Streptomyces sp. WAC01280]|uniref:hypothetical protein n=1 Tax=Streptomyces sp. WAC01280 TaxID=2487424 RepID=UPI000F768925|nr:hypothetical protein [Streptomyces sp. WAC01280]RSS52164.1 hypothetical protein EF909_33240 [Streptomyces sp. WAC01280]